MSTDYGRYTTTQSRQTSNSQFSSSSSSSSNNVQNNNMRQRQTSVDPSMVDEYEVKEKLQSVPSSKIAYSQTNHTTNNIPHVRSHSQPESKDSYDPKSKSNDFRSSACNNIIVIPYVGSIRSIHLIWLCPLIGFTLYVVFSVIISCLSFIFYICGLQHWIHGKTNLQAQEEHHKNYQLYINDKSHNSFICKDKNAFYTFRDYYPIEWTQNQVEKIAIQLEQLLIKEPDFDCASTIELNIGQAIFHVAIREKNYFGLGNHTIEHFINPRFVISNFDTTGNAISVRQDEVEVAANHCDGKKIPGTNVVLKGMFSKKIRSNKIIVYYKDKEKNVKMKLVTHKVAWCIQHYVEIFTCKSPCESLPVLPMLTT